MGGVSLAVCAASFPAPSAQFKFHSRVSSCLVPQTLSRELGRPLENTSSARCPQGDASASDCCSLFQVWRHNKPCTWAGHTSQPQLNSFCISFSFIEVVSNRGQLFNYLEENLDKWITRQKYGVGCPQETFYLQFLNSAHCLRGADKILLEKGFLKL